MTISFQRLWDNHPDRDSDPCDLRTSTGMLALENQCAVRMGVALKKIGVEVKGLRTCLGLGHPVPRGHQAHLLAAQEVGNWMVKNPSLFGKVKKYYPSEEPVKKVDGRKGIILCIDFWGDGGRGDHIDAWDGKQMRAGSADYIPPAKGIWFWELS